MPGRGASQRLVDIDLSRLPEGDITAVEWVRTGDVLEALGDRPEGACRRRPPGTAEDPATPQARRLRGDDLAYRPPSVSPGTSPAPTPNARNARKPRNPRLRHGRGLTAGAPGRGARDNGAGGGARADPRGDADSSGPGTPDTPDTPDLTPELLEALVLDDSSSESESESEAGAGAGLEPGPEHAHDLNIRASFPVAVGVQS